jgi:hypothetical protein
MPPRIFQAFSLNRTRKVSFPNTAPNTRVLPHSSRITLTTSSNLDSNLYVYYYLHSSLTLNLPSMYRFRYPFFLLLGIGWVSEPVWQQAEKRERNADTDSSKKVTDSDHTPLIGMNPWERLNVKSTLLPRTRKRIYCQWGRQTSAAGFHDVKLLTNEC